MNIKGKNVTILGVPYMVQSTETNDEQETVVLTRMIKKTHDEYPTTIYDLGYKSVGDIKFSKKNRKKAIVELKSHFDNIDNFDIASIDRSGLISFQGITSVYDASIDDDSVEVNSSIDGDITRILIDTKLLVDSYMLLKQLKKAQKKYNKTYSKSAKIDKVIDKSIKEKSPESLIKDLMDGKSFNVDKSGLPDIPGMEDMPEIFDAFLKSAETLVAGLIPQIEQKAETTEEKQAAEAVKKMFDAMKNLKGPRP